jgi:hypothetical protein
METEKIFQTVKDKMHAIKRKRFEPASIMVSDDIMYKIEYGRYSDVESYPFFPDFTQLGDRKFDKLFGLPIAILRTTDKDFIEVYVKI